MKQTIKGVIIGAVVAAGVSVLLAQSATWTTPRNWATDDLLTATQFNAQFRDNLLWLREDAQLTGTDALEDLGCGTLGTNEVLFSDCTWATIPDQTPANNSITQAKMADNAVGPDEMDPESATTGQVMMIGSGGDPSWEFPFEFPRTRSSRAVDASLNVDWNGITTSTINVGNINNAGVDASASFTISSVSGSGCRVRFQNASEVAYGVTTYTTNGAKTLSATVRFGFTYRGSLPVLLVVRRISSCTVDSGATLTLTIP